MTRQNLYEKPELAKLNEAVGKSVEEDKYVSEEIVAFQKSAEIVLDAEIEQNLKSLVSESISHHLNFASRPFHRSRLPNFLQNWQRGDGFHSKISALSVTNFLLKGKKIQSTHRKVL